MGFVNLLINGEKEFCKYQLNKSLKYKKIKYFWT